MPNYVLLNNIQHADLKVIDKYGFDSADRKAVVLIVPTEFVNIQREYPIFLTKDAKTQEYQAVALLGIQKDENLFLPPNSEKGSEWQASYVPAIIARGPFIVGSQERPGEGPKSVIYVDMGSPKISENEGKPLFLKFGGNSPYLEYIQNLLGAIQAGAEIGRKMYRMFDEMNLIEALTIDVDLKNGDKHRLAGYFSINENRLSELDGESLEKLNRAGYLQAAYLMLASQINLQKLIEMKNSRL